MSNLKKTISKSRERLFDARLGISKSRERLMGLRSFSQSVEALSALSQLNQENAVYQSCNNIFVPMITPTTKEADVCRMYKSLAAIDQIDEFDCTHKLGYFESRISKDDEDYNDIVTRHNTSLNTVIAVQDTKPGTNYMVNEARLRGGGRGGRSTDVCDKRCPRHNHRQPEAQPTQRIPKVNRAERMKREAQRRRKEKKEREREEKERQKVQSIEQTEGTSRNNRTTHEKSGESSNSPGGRRRSSSHVEQRIAERHERQQERLERQERKNSVSQRKRESTDAEKQDKSPVTERVRPGKTSGGLDVPQERPRSTTPTRKNKTKKTSNAGSDVSQASSLESVDGNLESPRSPQRPKRPTSLHLPEIKIFPEASSPACLSGDVNDNILKDSRREIDEAYNSLEEPVPCSRSQSMPSVTHTETSTSSTTTTGTIKEIKHEHSKPRRKFAELLDNPLFVRQAEISNQNCVQNNPDGEASEDLDKEKTLKIDSDRSTFGSCELTIIKEEEKQPPKKTLPSYGRSISTSSDLGSMVSASSECSLEREEFGSRSPATDVDTLEWRSRARAISVLNNPSSPKPRVLSRSNSMHLDSPVNPARPWGNLCDGAVARAMEKFKKKPEEQAAPEKTRRQSSPVMSPSSSPLLH